MVEQGAGLVQLVCRGEGGLRTGAVVPLVVVCAVAVGEVRIGELVEDLPQRPDTCQQVAEHGVGVGGLVEHPAGVRETPQ